MPQSIDTEYFDRGDDILVDLDNITDHNGDLVTDFTGWKFFSTLKTEKADDDLSALAKIDTADFTASGADSRAFGYIATEGLTLTLGHRYHVDAQAVNAAGKVATIKKWYVEFEQDITRRVS